MAGGEAMTTKQWWYIDEETLMAMLYAVADGESPDVVFAEAYANSAEADLDEPDG